MARDLRALADHIQARTQFEADAECLELLGGQFKGLQTKWNEIQSVAAWYQHVFTLLPETDEDSRALREVLLKSRTERLKAINASLPAHQRNRAAVEDLGSAIPQLGDMLQSNGSVAKPISELRGPLKEANTYLEEAIATILMADLRSDLPISSIGELLKAGEGHRASMAHVGSRNRVRELLGSSFQGIDSDLGPVKAAVRFAASVANSTIPRAVSEWLLCDEYFSRLSQLRQAVPHLLRP